MRQFFAVLSLILILAGCSSEPRPLKPVYPPPTPGILQVSRDAEVVTFADLNSNPQAYLNRLIRVSGNFVPLPTENCALFKGPRASWALIGDSLQMNAVGYESVVSLVPEGTPFVVDGVWQLYRGPAGCGKEPPSSSVWYVDVERIVSPNPILPNRVADTSDDFVFPLPTEPADEPIFEVPPEGGGDVEQPTIVTPQSPVTDPNDGYPAPPAPVPPATPVEDDAYPVGSTSAGGDGEVTQPVEPPPPPPTPTPSPTVEPTATPIPVPTQTPTEQPTDAPEPTAEPTATSTPTLEPTAEPTEESEDEATATPTETPEGDEATPTPDGDEATETPEPDETATPTETPTEEGDDSEEPTGTPTLEPTEEPTETPTATPTEGGGIPTEESTPVDGYPGPAPTTDPYPGGTPTPES